MAKHKRITTKGFEPSENKPYMQAMQELRRSSAASPHISKKYKGTKGAKNRAAIKESK